MLTGFTTELKLNSSQRQLLAQHAGYSRWCWNWALSTRERAFDEGLKVGLSTIRKFYTNHVKPEYEWQQSLSSRVYQYAFRHLDTAYSRWWKGLAQKPKFKKKGKNDSFTLDNTGKAFRLGGRKHKLPFLGWFKTYEVLPEIEVKSVTISRRANKWFISFHLETQTAPTKEKFGTVGVDLGIKALATLSNGEMVEGPKPLKRLLTARSFASGWDQPDCLRALVTLSRQLSRKQLDSANREKAKTARSYASRWSQRDCLRALARLHYKISCIRKDALHKLTSYLAKNFSTIAIEDLNVSGLTANRKLSKAISDMGFYEFRRQLEYKCSLYASQLYLASRWEPTSKRCSSCGEVKPNLTLADRTYCCSYCNLAINRDLNAALNLHHLGTSGSGGINASGQECRRRS